jgi:predicted dehydrogenase
VHELNMLGGLLGGPEEIRFAHLSPRSVSIDMQFGEAECHLSWVDLPGIARYRQEREEIVSYEEAFKRELVEFSDCMRNGREPRTSGEDGLRDMRLAEAIARTHAARAPGSARRDGASRIETGVL